MRGDVLVWGEDRELLNWLSQHGVSARAFDAGIQTRREVILALSGTPATGRTCSEHLPNSRVTSPAARPWFSLPIQPDGWPMRGPPEKSTPGSGRMPPVSLRWAPFPLAAKPSIGDVPTWYFRADYWAKRHPIFDGLPCSGILDYTYYREILNPMVFTGLQPPLEAVSGALDTSEGYHSDLQICVHGLGEGRIIMNTLQIRANLGQVPAAERLLRNMLNFAGRDRSKALADLSSDFAEQLRSVGY